METPILLPPRMLGQQKPATPSIRSLWISRPTPGLYRPLEKFDCCIVLFLQTAAQLAPLAVQVQHPVVMMFSSRLSILPEEQTICQENHDSAPCQANQTNLDTNTAEYDFSVQTSIRKCQMG